jgi:hypothetical protein
MKTPDLLTPPPRPFVPRLFPPPKPKPAGHKNRTQSLAAPDFSSPTLGLFHRAKAGRALYRWETVLFVLLGVSGLVAIVMAFLV